MQVIKRNGNKVEYNPEKIRIAISKANTDLPDEEIQRIYEETLKTVEQYNEISVEEISDIAENVMMRFGHYKMAKKFMLYRYKRELVRKSNTTDESILSLIRQENEEVMNENSNKNGVEISTQRDLIAGIASRDLTVRVLLPEDVAEAHRKGQIHFHDSDYAISPETNCCLVNIGDMLNNGTVMNGKMIERPKSFHVSCTVTSQIVAAIASSQYGGQSVDVSHLSPFLKESEDKFRREYSEDIEDKELVELLVRKRLKKELSAGIQTIQYQLNTLFSTQGQSPFVTLFLYLRKDDPYKKYTAMIIEEILNQRILGIKNEVGVYITPAFPKLVYVLTPENNLSGGEYDYLTHLAAKCNAKRIYPDYISEKVMMENTGGYCFSPMGKCKLQLI